MPIIHPEPQAMGFYYLKLMIRQTLYQLVDSAVYHCDAFSLVGPLRCYMMKLPG